VVVERPNVLDRRILREGVLERLELAPARPEERRHVAALGDDALDLDVHFGDALQRPVQQETVGRNRELGRDTHRDDRATLIN